MNDTKIWWGEFDLGCGDVGCWEVGGTRLWVDHCTDEWRLAWQRDPAADEALVRVTIPADEAVPEKVDERLRLAVSGGGARLRVVPALADRSVVSRPEIPFSVLAGESITLYLSTPLWWRLELVEGGKQLHEVAIQRPSDTWFGASTVEGELCYASRTHCRRRREELVPRPYRAVTQLKVDNRTEAPLLLERINLPVPTLSLFQDAAGGLWTQSAVLLRKPDDEMATLRLEERPPADIGPVERVGGPRQRSERTFMTRAFGALFKD